LPPGKFWCTKRIFFTDAALPVLALLSHILLYAPSYPLVRRLASAQNLSFPLIFPSQAENYPVSQTKTPLAL